MLQSDKNVWKFCDNIRNQNQYPLEEFCAVLMIKQSCCPRTGSLTLCARRHCTHIVEVFEVYILYIALCRKGIWMAILQSQHTDYGSFSVLYISANEGNNVHWLQITLISYLIVFYLLLVRFSYFSC